MNLSGERVAALRGHNKDTQKSSNIFGGSPLGPGSIASIQQQNHQEHFLYHQAVSGGNIPTSADARSSLKQDYQLKNAIKGTGVTFKRILSGNISSVSRPLRSQNLRVSADQKFL